MFPQDNSISKFAHVRAITSIMLDIPWAGNCPVPPSWKVCMYSARKKQRWFKRLPQFTAWNTDNSGANDYLRGGRSFAKCLPGGMRRRVAIKPQLSDYGCAVRAACSPVRSRPFFFTSFIFRSRGFARPCPPWLSTVRLLVFSYGDHVPLRIRFEYSIELRSIMTETTANSGTVG